MGISSLHCSGHVKPNRPNRESMSPCTTQPQTGSPTQIKKKQTSGLETHLPCIALPMIDYIGLRPIKTVKSIYDLKIRTATRSLRYS